MATDGDSEGQKASQRPFGERHSGAPGVQGGTLRCATMTKSSGEAVANPAGFS